MAEAALQNFKGDISKCVDVLTNNPEQISQIMEDKSKEYEKTEEARKRMKEDLGNEEGNQYYLILTYLIHFFNSLLFSIKIY